VEELQDPVPALERIRRIVVAGAGSKRKGSGLYSRCPEVCAEAYIREMGEIREETGELMSALQAVERG
jgi:hypothetical protein